MIDRYKKKGGFVQLLNLIETTGKEKAERFLKMIAEESPIWEAEIRRKSLSLDRLSTWNQTYLMEFVPRLSANVLGTALSPLPAEKQQIFLGALAFGERRKTEEFMKEAKPNAGEIAACQMKLLTEVRRFGEFCSTGQSRSGTRCLCFGFTRGATRRHSGQCAGRTFAAAPPGHVPDPGKSIAQRSDANHERKT